MINTINLPPFKKMCMTVGNLPSSFMESMTYYEALEWLYQYIDKEIKTAINTNSEAVSELQNAFVILKNYVDTYFDNLDVQEEINNKLDEMAESGELAEIIAQYLQVASVLAFDTKASLKAADNLIDGSIAKTIGELEYNDGKGNFYKIRTLTSGDVIDEDNIIALTNYPTLIAEKLPDFKINEINSKIDGINTEIDDLKKAYRGMMCITKYTNDDNHYLHYSDDGLHWYRVGNALTSLTSDSSALTKIGNFYYYIGNNTYQYSTDLINWSEAVNMNTTTDLAKWGANFYLDDDTIYIYQAVQYNSSTLTNAVNNTSYYFKIQYTTATQNEDGSLTINGTWNDLLSVNNESFIDPSIAFINNTYYLAVKNEKTCQIEIYNMSNLTTIGSKQRTIKAVGVEAPQFIVDGADNLLLYCHDYAISNDYRTGGTGQIQTYNLVQMTTYGTLRNDETLGLVPCWMPKIFRHAGICMCDEYDYNKILSIGIKPSLLFRTTNFGLTGDGNKTIGISGDPKKIINYPCVNYYFGGGSSTAIDVTVLDYFKNEPLNLCIGVTKILWNSNGDIAGYAKGKYLVNDNTKIPDNTSMTVANASDNLNYGFRVPWNSNS